MAGDGVSVSTFYGTGSPEGVVTAGIGSIYLRTDGSTNTSLYRKESGTGNTGWIATSSVTVPISVANGGTGADNSATVQGVVPYFSATGVISGLAVGTNGQFLQTQGGSANPQWAFPADSNVLFQYQGQVDQAAGSGGAGEVTNSSLTPATGVGNYRYLQVTGGAYVQIWTTKFIKTSGINTVTIWCRIWIRLLNGIANLKVDIGGHNSNVTGTASQSAPEWKSFTIDVSALTNGTSYDVTASLFDSGVNGLCYCSNIIGFAS